MKAGVSDEQLAEMAVSFRDENKLVISGDGEQVRQGTEIICSLGLVNKESTAERAEYAKGKQTLRSWRALR